MTAVATTPVLDVADVVVSYRARRSRGAAGPDARRLVAVDGVTLSLGSGETLGVVGESGCGKSTLARTMVGLIRPDRGSVRLNGSDLSAMSTREMRQARQGVQLIYQDPYSSLNPRMTIGAAIAEPARVHGLTDRAGSRDLAIGLLARVGLPASLSSRRPQGLSGGQRQRVAIARALAVSPRVIIADEAVSALDVSVQAQVLNLLSDLRDDLSLSMVFIAHQLGVVAHVADRVAVMHLGRVVETGRTDEVFRSPSHPYTRTLLAAQAGRHRRGSGAASPVEGEAPSGYAIPTGCRFRTRCPIAQGICETVDPPAIEVSPGHLSWCHQSVPTPLLTTGSPPRMETDS
jgi:oligopeptide/dipeptide ABC transporter ATP-binding protein